MKTCIFPGQGSQSRGMGGELFDAFPEQTAKADEILGYSIKALCLEDPNGELDNTRFTQPALFVVNALSYLKWLQDGNPEPDYLAGHSLGEFNALLAAGAFDFETGLKLVKKRGELMSQVSGGGMAAVANATAEEIEATLRGNGLDNVFLANFNTPSQIVISGLKAEIDAAKPLLEKGRVMVFPLKTSGAFHTRFMQDAQREFRSFLAGFQFHAPRIPVIANATAQPYVGDAVAETIAVQIASPVRWSDSILHLLDLGTDAEPMTFQEIGHGNVLTRLVKTIRDKAPPRSQRAGAAPEPPPVATAGDTPPVQAPSNEASTRPSRQDATSLVEAWNRSHPVGTKVRSALMGEDVLETRTEAIVLFGHRAAVYLKGYEGYFALEEISPAV